MATLLDLEPIDTSDFDPERSIDLRTACYRYLRGRVGRPLNYGTAQKWAREGYRSARLGGSLLILPTVFWSGQRRLMPEWAVEFERRRAALGGAA